MQIWKDVQKKLAQAFMKYKEGEFSKEAYIEMKDDRNNWKEFCEERKKSRSRPYESWKNNRKKKPIFTKSVGTGWDNQNQCGTCGGLD